MSTIVGALFMIAEHTLDIMATKEANKHLNRVIALRKMYEKESTKKEMDQNHAYLDNITDELCLIVKSISQFGKKNS